MRFHYTSAFSERRTEYDAAMAEYKSFDDSDRAAEAAAEARLSAADDAYFAAEATTPFELLAKLRAAHGRQLMIGDGGVSMESIEADLHRMQRHALSPDIASAWAAWRTVETGFTEAGYDEESSIVPGQTWEQVRANLYCEIALKSCTTAGDFILKRYLSLLTLQGSCDRPSLITVGTANPWDVYIDDIADDARFDHADILGAYQDIDDSDIGANLLAYGLPEFDAAAWMQAAQRASLVVNLVQQPLDGGWQFGWSNESEVTERLRREQRRLIRIMNFPGLDRHRAIADEVRREWPHLIFATTATTVKADQVAA